MESNLEVFYKVRKDIEEKLNEQFSLILRANNNVDDLMGHLDLKRLEEDVSEKYNEPVESIEVKLPAESDELWASLNMADFDDYDKISQNLNNTKSISTQLKTLDKLLAAYIIDTKQKSWMLLSRNLQQCLISTNDEVFKRSMKIHYKIISTPTTSSEGYLNLIQALILMFNGVIFRNSQVINESIKYHRRTINIFKMILKTQKIMLKNWLHTKQALQEEVLITYIYMLNYSMGNQYELGTLDFLALLDSEGRWFKKFCYGLQTRNIILGCLKKTPNLIKYFINTFLGYLDENLEDSRNQRQFVNFLHSAHFLSEFLSYRQSVSVFPIKVKMFQEAITYEYLILHTIAKINDWNESSRKKVVIEFLRPLLVYNCNLILNLEIQRKLFEPFNLRNIDKKQLYLIIEKNIHILKIMNDIFKLHCSRFVLYNLTDVKKPERKTKRIGSTSDLFTNNSNRERNLNLIQIILNVTIACIRQFVNKSESQHYVNNVIFELLDCCKNLFSSNPRTYSFINTNKLIISLRDLYKTILNHNSNNNNYKPRIAECLCFFIESGFSALKILESETEFLHDIVGTVLMNKSSIYNNSENSLLSSKLILSLADHKEGINIITKSHDLLLKELLLKIWAAENDENGLVLGVNNDLEVNTYKLLFFLHLLSYNFKAIKALLSYENEATVVENQEKPLVLAELVENCLDPACLEAVDTSLGLKIIKVLIANVDVLLYLQKRYKLQESLIELQVNSRMLSSEEFDNGSYDSNPSTAILIDECSSLRHNILLSIKYTGKVDAVLNEKLIGQANIVVAPYQSSSAIRRHSKTSELQKFLHESKNGLHDHSWLVQARRAFKAGCKDKYKISIITDLIEQVPKNTTQSPFMWPSSSEDIFGLFSEEQYGISFVVSSAIRRHSKTSELQKFLHESKNGLHDHSWLVQARRAFKAGCKDKYKISIITDLIEQVPKNTTQSPFMWPSSSEDIFGLFSEEQYGISFVVRFGVQNGILQSSAQNEENLILLLKQARTFLNVEYEEFVGFDWFTSMIFLICTGNLEKCKHFILNMVKVPAAPLIWPMFAAAVNKENISHQFYQQLEIILEDTTRLNCALQTLGTSPKHVVKKWLSHCFFTILDFSEICNFISMAIIYPPEYTILFSLAIFEHMKTDIFTLTHNLDLITILKTTKVIDFHIADYFNFMDKLFKQYKNVLQIELKTSF